MNKALAASGREDDDRDFTARGPSRFLLRFLKACHSPPPTPPRYQYVASIIGDICELDVVAKKLGHAILDLAW